MPDKVGGIIASRRNLPAGTDPTYPTPNVASFDKELTHLVGGNWVRDYRWVRPWADAEISTHVDQLCADADVKAIVVTGTTIGEKVKARRDTQANKPWIVAATDDGNWLEQFPNNPSNANHYVTQKITGSTSGYSTGLTGSGKTITYYRARTLKQDIGSTAQVGVLRGTPSLTAPAGSHSEQERANQLAAVADALGVLVANLKIIEVAINNAGQVTFAPAEPPAGVNGLVILGDAVTFLARQEIVDKLLYGGGTWGNIVLSSGPHKAFLAAGLSSTEGPGMTPTHKKSVGLYQRAALYVSQVLQTLPPTTPDPPYVPGNRSDFEKF
jgi:hypothetical protein